MIVIPELHYIPIALAWYSGLIASHYYSSELILHRSNSMHASLVLFTARLSMLEFSDLIVDERWACLYTSDIAGMYINVPNNTEVCDLIEFRVVDNIYAVQ